MLSTMKRALITVGLVACVAGCGASGHSASVTAQARLTTARFFTAVDEMDGRVACPLMTSSLLGRMQRSQPQPLASRCQQAMLVLEEEYGLPSSTTGSLPRELSVQRREQLAAVARRSVDRALLTTGQRTATLTFLDRNGGPYRVTLVRRGSGWRISELTAAPRPVSL